MISIFASDGSIKISHAGIETGQGIHTKGLLCYFMTSLFLSIVKKNNLKPKN